MEGSMELTNEGNFSDLRTDRMKQRNARSTRMRAVLGGLALAAIAAAVPAPAHATPIDYVLVQNGGLQNSDISVSGGFTYDSATGDVTNLEITFDNGLPSQAFWEGTYFGPGTLISAFGHRILQFNDGFSWAGSPTGVIDVNVAMAFDVFVDGGPNYLWSGGPVYFSAGGLAQGLGLLDPLNPPYVIAAVDTGTPTPEPATCGMMIVVFTGAGAWMRTARRKGRVLAARRSWPGSMIDHRCSRSSL
jgi:hypothetical protein